MHSCGHRTDWVLLSLPAIAEVDQFVQIGPDKFHHFRAGDLLHPERMPRRELEARRALDPETFAAHYQQRPIPPGGIIIQRTWIRYYDVLPPRNASSVLLQSWDTASKSAMSNDWSVCTTWLIQDDKYYLHTFCESVWIIHRYVNAPLRTLGPTKPTKSWWRKSGIGESLIQELQKASLPVVPVRPVRNKVTRMQEQSLKFQGGQVFLPRQAPWLVGL